jgi:pectinesterase
MEFSKQRDRGVCTRWLLFAGATWTAVACNGETENPSSGSTGGQVSSGGAATTGGTVGAGGTQASATSSGGETGAAGSPTTGGIGAQGGTSAGVGSARPQLTSALAEDFTVLKYLAQTGAVTAPTVDSWDPTAGLGDPSTFTANYVVGSDQEYQTVQAAVTAAVAAGGTDRRYIQVLPGIYREPLCIPANAPPLTLYGAQADATLTTVVFNNIAGMSLPVTTPNPCVTPSSTATTLGTDGSATVAVYANDFQAMNLTFSNDADESTVSSGTQAVALHSRGDKAIYQNLRCLGHQDTILVKTSATTAIARAYFKDCYAEGDMDFICGRGTAVFEGGEVRFVTTRRSTGNILAPSTQAQNPYGFLLIRTNLTGPSATAGSVTLGRAWDESQVDVATYRTNVAAGGAYPNGQALIRESVLSEAVQSAAPWTSAATTSRPFSSVATDGLPANRLYEYDNSGPGSLAPSG